MLDRLLRSIIMVYNTCGRYSMYMYYIVYCQEIAHYNLKNPKKIKNMAAEYIELYLPPSGPCVGLLFCSAHLLAEELYWSK